MSEPSERTTHDEPDAEAPTTGIHPFLVLGAVIVVAAISTWLIPAGAFDREEVDGQEVVVEGSYQAVDEAPAGLTDVFTSIHLGMVEAAAIIFFIFVVGGAFGVMRRTQAVEVGITALAGRMRRSQILIIPILMLVFGIAGASFGMFEEALPFVLLLAPIAVRLGYDSMTGTAVVLVGVATGFMAAMTNPFTVGVAQGIAEVPLFSGIELRAVMWVTMMAVSIAFVMVYASRVRRDPARSLTRAADARAVRADEEAGVDEEDPRLSMRQAAVLLLLGLSLVVMVWGVLAQGWFMTEIAALFVAFGLACGLIGGLGLNGTVEAFGEGCREMVVGALVVGFAYAVLQVLSDAAVIDTILHGVSSWVAGAGAAVAAGGMLGVQALMNIVIPSGSGQAALTMPIMTPLADLVGVDRQTAVLAFQLGDGLTNILTPTNGLLLAALALAKISWFTWARFIWPLILVHAVIALGFVLAAHLWIWPGS
ncbi:MAG: TIGR00366 family protein [Nesterenkonia sp.]|uniref:YfcC family protein n=1 Tax=Nesterenkonia marinintestina TaxID=2979865 RepID=UPI0021C092EF|nr:TIGR00366 family protein [Nesterenkonia sp. GX14115]MDO5493208.1 TIGR00366 family protein [Nesterenkonia sp.]